MLYVENEIPEAATNLQRDDAERLRDKFKTDTYERRGALHWKSNNAVVPLHCFRDAYCSTPAGQDTAYERELEAFIRDYSAQNKNRVPSPEEQFEMKAAFGPGATVVDVITGQKFST